VAVVDNRGKNDHWQQIKHNTMARVDRLTEHGARNTTRDARRHILEERESYLLTTYWSESTISS